MKSYRPSRVLWRWLYPASFCLLARSCCFSPSFWVGKSQLAPMICQWCLGPANARVFLRTSVSSVSLGQESNISPGFFGMYLSRRFSHFTNLWSTALEERLNDKMWGSSLGGYTQIDPNWSKLLVYIYNMCIYIVYGGTLFQKREIWRSDHCDHDLT